MEKENELLSVEAKEMVVKEIKRLKMILGYFDDKNLSLKKQVKELTSKCKSNLAKIEALADISPDETDHLKLLPDFVPLINPKELLDPGLKKSVLKESGCESWV